MRILHISNSTEIPPGKVLVCNRAEFNVHDRPGEYYFFILHSRDEQFVQNAIQIRVKIREAIVVSYLNDLFVYFSGCSRLLENRLVYLVKVNTKNAR